LNARSARPAPQFGLTRQISKLIAALHRQRLQELGEPEAVLTETAIRNARRLLVLADLGLAGQALAERTLEELIGVEWVGSNPWAAPYLTRIKTIASTAQQTNGGVDLHSCQAIIKR
jgi:hypothetical protein